MRKYLIAAALIATALAVGLAVVPAGATAEANNWYTCKYVGPPSSPNETLAGGQNPILTDENAILAQTGLATVSIGDEFADGQDQSVVIAGPVAPPGTDPEPTCPTTPVTTTQPPPPPPTTTTPPPVTTTTPPAGAPPACPGKVTLGPWYGDPRINITLVGKGTFVVSGGIQRFTNTTTFTETLACGQTFRIGRYKVQSGHYLTITQDGQTVVHVKPPRVR
jgi:hypothetical protein